MVFSAIRDQPTDETPGTITLHEKVCGFMTWDELLVAGQRQRSTISPHQVMNHLVWLLRLEHGSDPGSRTIDSKAGVAGLASTEGSRIRFH